MGRRAFATLTSLAEHRASLRAQAIAGGVLALVLVLLATALALPGSARTGYTATLVSPAPTGSAQTWVWSVQGSPSTSVSVLMRLAGCWTPSQVVSASASDSAGRPLSAAVITSGPDAGTLSVRSLTTRTLPITISLTLDREYLAGSANTQLTMKAGAVRTPLTTLTTDGPTCVVPPPPAPGTPTPTATAPVDTPIESETGGTVTIDDRVEIVIPGGALDRDAFLRVTVSPPPPPGEAPWWIGDPLSETYTIELIYRDGGDPVETLNEPVELRYFYDEPVVPSQVQAQTQDFFCEPCLTWATDETDDPFATPTGFVWNPVPTEVDTTNNIAMTWTTHFSRWVVFLGISEG